MSLLKGHDTAEWDGPVFVALELRGLNWFVRANELSSLNRVLSGYPGNLESR